MTAYYFGFIIISLNCVTYDPVLRFNMKSAI